MTETELRLIAAPAKIVLIRTGTYTVPDVIEKDVRLWAVQGDVLFSN